jgi:hypothetical protein
MHKRACSWTVIITIADCWIADGFNPDSDDFHRAVTSAMLGCATPDEVTVTVTKAPTKAQIDAAIDRVE